MHIRDFFVVLLQLKGYTTHTDERNIDMTTGERIKLRRLELQMSADDLAALVGVNRATVYRYESDEIRNMGTDILVPLAKALRTTPAWLMGWDDDDSSDPEAERDAALQAAFDRRPEMRTLFSIAESASAADIEKAIRIIEALKGVPEKD